MACHIDCWAWGESSASYHERPKLTLSSCCPSNVLLALPSFCRCNASLGGLSLRRCYWKIARILGIKLVTLTSKLAIMGVPFFSGKLSRWVLWDECVANDIVALITILENVGGSSRPPLKREKEQRAIQGRNLIWVEVKKSHFWSAPTRQGPHKIHTDIQVGSFLPFG